VGVNVSRPFTETERIEHEQGRRNRLHAERAQKYDASRSKYEVVNPDGGAQWRFGDRWGGLM
jgi:hypothetical protein